MSESAVKLPVRQCFPPIADIRMADKLAQMATQNGRELSASTRLILRAMTLVLVVGLLLAGALFISFGAEVLGVLPTVAGAFSTIAVLIFYTGVAAIVLRIALIWSKRRDR